jgi:hypothetical protein
MTMAVAAVAAGAGGLGLLGAAPAGADTSSSSGAAAPAGGASQLGGYTLTATGSGLSVFYEQPNFPLPATPTLEFDLGYSTASYNAGPVGTANASVLWPGAVVAGGGSQLPLLLNPYLQQYIPQLAPTISPLIPNVGNYPVVATTAFPQGPQTASNNNGPMAMNSSSTQSGSQASSSVGIVGGPANQSALPAGLLSIQALGSTSQSTVDNLGNAIAEATSTVHGIDIGGLIQIGTVTSTATGSSDGTQGKVAGTSTATGITVAGEPVTVDSSGVHVLGNSQNPLAALIPSVNTVLQTAGITIALTNPTDTVNGASAARQLDGLSVTINLSTYDDNFNKLVAMLPKQLTSGLSQLPVPSPYKQVVTLDFGWVNVSSAASPAYTDLGGADLGGSGDNGGTLATLGSAGTSDLGSSDLGLGSTGTGSSATPTGSTSGPGGTVIAAAPAALFKGVGTGLIILGLLLAAVLVALLLGADKAVGSLAAGTVCAGEDPLNLG